MTNQSLHARLEQPLDEGELYRAKNNIEDAFNALQVLDSNNMPNDPQFQNILRSLSAVAQSFLFQLPKTFENEFKKLPADDVNREMFRRALKAAVLESDDAPDSR